MRIGIITAYHNNKNYGGLLQAYALQYYLKQFGVDAVLVSFERKQINNVIRRLKKLGKRQLIERVIQKRRFQQIAQEDNRYMKRNDLFNEFEESIPHTPTVQQNNISSVSEGFDALIVGSDNVWRPESAFDDIVFLKFATASQYKMSYAASVGVTELTRKEKNTFRSELQCFNDISVRERYSAEVLSNLLGKSVSYDLDPTLLLSDDQWETIEHEVKLSDDYIFEYFTDDNIEAKKRIHSFAEKLGLKVIGIPHTQGRYHKSDELYIDIPAIECGPREWVYLLHHSKYVFTDSFHGTVFSILFKKNFWTISKQKTHAPNGEGRQEDLLKSLALLERYVKDINSFTDSDLMSPANFVSAFENLNERRSDSTAYLTRNLNSITSQ